MARIAYAVEGGVKMKRQTEPNYDVFFNSAVEGLRTAYENYKIALWQYIGHTWYDKDGHFTVVDGHEYRAQKVSDAYAEVNRLISEVEYYRRSKDAEVH